MSYPLQPRPPRDTLTAVAASRRAFNAVMLVTCPKHARPKGEPCWRVPKDRGGEALAVCNSRVERAQRAKGVRGPR